MNAYDIRRLAANVAELETMIKSDAYASGRASMEGARDEILATLQGQSAAAIWDAMKGAEHSMRGTPVIAVLEDELTRRAYAR